MKKRDWRLGRNESGRLGGGSGWGMLGVMLLMVLLAQPASALLLISELFYDATGSDDGQVFVELYGDPGLSLDGWVVEATNGSNGSVVFSLTLSGTVPNDGFLVAADTDSQGVTAVSNADLFFGRADHQNGPENLLLKWNGIVIDALGYGNFGPNDVYEGEGAPALDAPAGSSLARRYANFDSDDNAADFEVLPLPTPGDGLLTAVPEPGSGVLLLSGLFALVWLCGSAARSAPPSGRL